MEILEIRKILKRKALRRIMVQNSKSILSKLARKRILSNTIVDREYQRIIRTPIEWSIKYRRLSEMYSSSTRYWHFCFFCVMLYKRYISRLFANLSVKTMLKFFFLFFIASLLFFPFISNAESLCPGDLSCDPKCPHPCCCTPPDNECSKGLVPCGRNCDDPDTNACECCPCQLCHFFVMFNSVVKFVMFDLVPTVAAHIPI